MYIATHGVQLEISFYNAVPIVITVDYLWYPQELHYPQLNTVPTSAVHFHRITC